MYAQCLGKWRRAISDLYNSNAAANLRNVGILSRKYVISKYNCVRKFVQSINFVTKRWHEDISENKCILYVLLELLIAMTTSNEERAEN